jgi:hypothetical protein
MKTIMRYFNIRIFSVALAAVSLFSCEEDEKVKFQGAEAPVLTISSTDDLVLAKDEEAYNSLQFQWTNPDYQFTNGTNTQDVNYTLEIDTAGSDFSNPKKVTLTFTKEQAKDFKVKDLNNTLSGLELQDYMPHEFEFRIKSTLANSSLPQYSNTVKIKISTYLDVVYPVPAELFITGAATPKNWMGGGDAPVASQQFTKINAYTFELASLDITGGSGFLFVPVYGNWDNKYGFTGTAQQNKPAGDTFKPAGNDFISPATGTYKITVNFKTGKYSFEKL